MLQHIALALLTLSPLTVQEQEYEGPAVYELSELSIQHYVPVHLKANGLDDLAYGIVGRTFYLKERGGVRGQPVENLVRVGRSLLLYDTAEYLEHMQATIKALDVPQTVEQQAPVDHEVTFHYTPRHISVMDLWSIANGMSSHVTMAGERQVLVVRDELSVVNEIKALLAEVDVPVDQVLVTTYLVRGWNPKVESSDVQAQGPDLPADLREHLGRLIPGLEFQNAGFAMLRTAALPGRGGRVEVQLSDLTEGVDFALSFTPSAYDNETGSLSVEECSLTALGKAGPRRIFSTNTVFRGGEYTVLGATGAKPMFVVLRLTQV